MVGLRVRDQATALRLLRVAALGGRPDFATLLDFAGGEVDEVDGVAGFATGRFER